MRIAFLAGLPAAKCRDLEGDTAARRVAPNVGFSLFAAYSKGSKLLHKAANSPSSHEPNVFGELSALASNEVNFAKRPLAGIYAKLTKLRDNKVVAMV